MEKVILVTGGSGYIGKEVVTYFLEKGEKVVNLDKMDAKIDHANYLWIPTDVTNIQEIIQAKEIVQNTYGYISHLISIAGINRHSEIFELEGMEIEDIDLSIRLNLNSHIYVSKIMLPLLKIRRNEDKSITIISSINAIRGYGLPAYSAAKAGIYGFVRAVCNELGEHGIRINSISLGTVPHNTDNEMDEHFVRYKKLVSLDDFVRKEDVAEMLFYITNQAKALTGQNITLDAGQSI